MPVHIVRSGRQGLISTFAGFRGFGSSGASALLASEDFVWKYGGNGKGSTRTRNRRFTTLYDSAGTSIDTSASSAANGDIFTVTQSGYYAIAYTDYDASFSATLGISLNDAVGTAAIFNLSAANRLSMGATINSAHRGTCLWAGWLNEDDFISANTGATGTLDDTVMFYMARLNFA